MHSHFIAHVILLLWLWGVFYFLLNRNITKVCVRLQACCQNVLPLSLWHVFYFYLVYLMEV